MQPVVVAINLSSYDSIVVMQFTMSLNFALTAAGYNFVPLINHQLEFSYDGILDPVICFNITILDNEIFEEKRVTSFNIVLNVNDTNLVTLGNNQAIVNISDDDCKFWCRYTAFHTEDGEPGISHPQAQVSSVKLC